MKAWQKGAERSPSGEEATRLMVETSRLHGALAEAGDRLACEFGLTSARWQVLGAVWDEPRTVSGIARFMGLTRQSVQRTATRLEVDGFVEFKENPDHARARLVSLTRKGETTLKALSHKQAQWISQVTEGMEPANIRIATGVMRGLVNRLQEKSDR
ncbi:MarR family transcriptional regulator [Pseudodesulfovibrio sp.]|nr:MarR family transcriptional regulator [Pseudodesulfovibrio sp.]